MTEVTKDIFPTLTMTGPKAATKSRVEYVVQAADRPAAKAELEKYLVKYGIKYKDGVRTSSSIDMMTTDVVLDGITHRFFFKPKSGGSGAGAEVTALGECWQAFCSAARQKKGSALVDAKEVVSLLNTSVVSTTTDCDRTVQQCIKGLDPLWLYSGIAIANELPKELQNTQYTFHRGGKIIAAIEKAYNTLRKPAGVTLNINKWNPADIWAFKKSYEASIVPELKKITTLDDLNQYILAQFKKQNMIGVSLKKLASATAKPTREYFNDGSPRASARFDSYRIRPASKPFFDSGLSKDAYIKFKIGSYTKDMQLRTFSAGMSGWQGEIKGTGAAGGKIGGGNLQEAMIQAGIPKTGFIDQSAFKSQSKPTNKTTVELMTKFYNHLKETADKKADTKLMEQHLKNFDNNWLYSKFLSMQFLYTILSKGKEDQVCSELVSIASSSTPVSSVFIKYS